MDKVDLRKKFHAGRMIFIGDLPLGGKPSLRYLDKNDYVTALCGWDDSYKAVIMQTELKYSDCISHLDL
ncbi:hypothetical protein OXIME_001677 [Oxyplasma meridianum]|uniref:Uncharacterized protein n=1 Tax=Oxyplasma meridianum TaxID=3073602 RepID=A0AAX4NHR7_9ARCH